MTDHTEIYLEPERIWAGKHHTTWWQSRPHHQMTEYVRADAHAAALARIDRLEVAFERLENLTAHDAGIVAAALQQDDTTT